MIEIKKLSKQYDAASILSDITCSLPQGKITSIVGMSGVWKSTLLHTILWNITQYTGSIEIWGVPQSTYLQNHRIAYVSQKYNSFPWLTVSQNISLWNNHSTQVHEEYMRKLWLYEYKDQYPDFLSWWQQQRVSLARAFLQDVDIVALDEPFSSLDRYVKDQLHEVLISLMHEQKKTIVLITHDIEEAVYLSDQVIVLKGTPWEVTGKYQYSHWKKRTKDLRYSAGFMKDVKEVSQAMI